MSILAALYVKEHTKEALNKQVGKTGGKPKPIVPDAIIPAGNWSRAMPFLDSTGWHVTTQNGRVFACKSKREAEILATKMCGD